MIITEALVNSFNSNSVLKTDFPGGIWLDLRLGNGDWPYLVISQTANPVFPGGSQTERVYETKAAIVFKAFTMGLANQSEAGRLIEEVHSQLGGRPVPMDNTGICTSLWPIQDPIVKIDTTRGPDAGYVFYGMITYHATIIRTMPGP